MNEDYLQHHGIRGMRWGVRRNREKFVPEGLSTRKNKKALYRANAAGKQSIFYKDMAKEYDKGYKKTKAKNLSKRDKEKIFYETHKKVYGVQEAYSKEALKYLKQRYIGSAFFTTALGTSLQLVTAKDMNDVKGKAVIAAGMALGSSVAAAGAYAITRRPFAKNIKEAKKNISDFDKKIQNLPSNKELSKHKVTEALDFGRKDMRKRASFYAKQAMGK